MMNFTIVQNEVFDLQMSDGAFRLYCLLQSYCFGKKDSCFPAQGSLARRMNKSIRSIQRYLKELVSLDLIHIQRRGSTSNVYKLVRKGLHENLQGIIERIRKKSSPSKETLGKERSPKENQKKGPSSKKKSVFHSFSQREYDFTKLEELLLGKNGALEYEDCIR